MGLFEYANQDKMWLKFLGKFREVFRESLYFKGIELFSMGFESRRLDQNTAFMQISIA